MVYSNTVKSPGVPTDCTYIAPTVCIALFFFSKCKKLTLYCKSVWMKSATATKVQDDNNNLNTIANSLVIAFFIVATMKLLQLLYEQSQY